MYSRRENVPLDSGTVGTYYPFHLDSQGHLDKRGPDQSLNTNPITLDAAGRAIIYGVDL